ncbi:DedA family protein [Geitlerinema sp. PCC 7407]|uniref:DedA family protein n=1 Tax=Geitlerinema sp. PCC 7407 TaxID=1173025 RepID=UPI00029FD25A|nr:DedA family protein [Geitlerinema sp. PCC 7407]AFY66987.1 SNARE associated Golgi protein-like protein [Geitlerinema sp. PCC 7407]
MSAEIISLESIQEIAHQYGYGAVFFGILLENMGIPLPGETITLVGGFLAGNDELNVWLVLLSAIAGAIVGDSCGYWIGRWGGWPFLLRLGKIFRIQEEQIAEGRRQFSENAAKAVFLGRFIALLRIFAGPLAGIAQMPYRQFLLYNAAGAALWASVMVGVSFFIGQVLPLEEVISWVARFAIAAFVLLAAWIGVPLWLESRKIAKQVEPQE